jgi:hypothetical protein
VGNRNTPDGIAADEVVGPIDGIDHPNMFGLEGISKIIRAALIDAFLPNDHVIGECVSKTFEDYLFRCFVSFREQRLVRLHPCAEIYFPKKIAGKSARIDCKLDARFEKLVVSHVRPLFRVERMAPIGKREVEAAARKM